MRRYYLFSYFTVWGRGKKIERFFDSFPDKMPSLSGLQKVAVALSVYTRYNQTTKRRVKGVRAEALSEKKGEGQ